MAGNYGDTSLDAVPTGPMAFPKYLKHIHDGLTRADIKRMCFLCRDLIPSQDLESITRGLQLFTQFKKQMLISTDDVSFLVELLEDINRNDLVKVAMRWPTASRAVARQPQMSSYRLLLYNLAIKSTNDDVEEMKHMVSGYININMDGINAFQLLVELEKQDIISQDNVSTLHDIVTNKQLIKQVEDYERVGYSHTPSTSLHTSGATYPTNHQQGYNTNHNSHHAAPTTNTVHPTNQTYGIMIQQTQYHSQNPSGFPTGQVIGVMGTPAAAQSQNPSGFPGQVTGVMGTPAAAQSQNPSEFPPGQVTRVMGTPPSAAQSQNRPGTQTHSHLVGSVLEDQLGRLDISDHEAPEQVSEATATATGGQPLPQEDAATNHETTQAAALTSLIALLTSINTFPPETGNLAAESQGAKIPPNVDRLLHFDSPDTDPSFLNIGPWDCPVSHEGNMPCYPMTRIPRGLCIIINNMEFAEATGGRLKDRSGSDIDAAQLIVLFHNLGFYVRSVNNQTAGEMYNLLESLRASDHRNYDCFVCCILTHGKLGLVYGCDGETIEITELTGLFTGVKCPSLAGKPKVFFLQACQGKELQVGVKTLETDSPNQPVPMIPSENDFLVGYSTVPGYASFRSCSKGSWYINTLVQALELYHDKIDMQNLLALVNGHMSKCSDKKGNKQSSSHNSRLTQALFL